MINPYNEIDWSKVQKTVGTTHDHCTTDAQLTHLKNGGVEFLTVSNYRPSTPFYPYEQQSGITVDLGNIIEAPNAEHHNMGGKRANGLTDIGASVHVNSMGSSFSSGSPPDQEPVGCNGTYWHVVFANIINSLDYPDGGGITLNHPKWTIETRGGCDLNTYMKMLDFSPYVLGIEFFNETCLSYDTGWALDYWDEILSTGRRCWGFAVPDHGCQTKDNWQGRIIYLTDNTLTQETLLTALRSGSFYSQINNTDLAFTGFDYNEQSGVLTVSTNNAQYLNVVVDAEYTRIDSSGVTFDVPKNAKYVRVEAHTSEDSIYSNPIMLTDSKKVRTGETLILMY